MIGEPALGGSGVQIPQQREPATHDDDFTAPARLPGFFRRRPFVENMLLIFLGQLGKRVGAVICVLVPNARLRVLNLLQHLGQHELRGVLVG
ncbi:MAG TPA: hypothetical protein VM529_24455 [Gemmata sp.]|nr:hypothetical protein [Gemmata sp.]